MEKFHLTIINNETDEKLIDTDTCAIVGAFDVGDKVHALCMTTCSTVDLVNVLAGVLSTVDKILADKPKPLAKLVKKLIKANKRQ